MSKKITHEYIRNYFKNNFNANDVRYEDLRIITEYVSQQEKQEKLLELYKKLSVIRNDLLSYCEVVDDDYDDFEYIETDLEKQIKELENENNR